ncbi:hypothetical protein SUNI508_05451 [Seiridium unicorne]|uniref:Uncharacterized protein n=1 Tax=Seiridium unicorne TaxID=138068 RepID=A0ABR2V4K4_9PEZI
MAPHKDLIKEATVPRALALNSASRREPFVLGEITTVGACAFWLEFDTPDGTQKAIPATDKYDMALADKDQTPRSSFQRFLLIASESPPTTVVHLDDVFLSPIISARSDNSRSAFTARHDTAEPPLDAPRNAPNTEMGSSVRLMWLISQSTCSGHSDQVSRKRS